MTNFIFPISALKKSLYNLADSIPFLFSLYTLADSYIGHQLQYATTSTIDNLLALGEKGNHEIKSYARRIVFPSQLSGFKIPVFVELNMMLHLPEKIIDYPTTLAGS